MFKKILISLFIWRALTIFFAYLATLLIPMVSAFAPALHLKANLSYYLWIWANLDGHHYLKIAEWGYRQFEQPFFPLFPILIRLTTNISHLPLLISGLLISHLSLFLALFVMIKLLIIDNQKNKMNLFFFALLLFPTSFFYGAVYNDSLFLLLASSTILLARRKKWILSSITGSLATLARLNGLALLIFILAEYFTSTFSDPVKTWNIKKISIYCKKQLSIKKIFDSKIFYVALIPTVFIGYLIYNQVVFGHWYLLFKAMIVWHQDKLIMPLQVFWRYAKIFYLNSPYDLTYWVAFLEMIFVCLYIFLIIYSFKKIRLSYWIFMVISILIPSITGTFAGMPRYGLHIYPLFLSLTLFLSERNTRVKIFYFTITLLIMFVMLALFTRGYFIA